MTCRPNPHSRPQINNLGLWYKSILSPEYAIYYVLVSLSLLVKNQISFTFSRPQDQYQRIFSLFWPLSTPWSEYRRRYVTELKTDINGFVTFTPNGSLLKSWYCRCSLDLLGAPQNTTLCRLSPDYFVVDTSLWTVISQYYLSVSVSLSSLSPLFPSPSAFYPFISFPLQVTMQKRGLSDSNISYSQLALVSFLLSLFTFLPPPLMGFRSAFRDLVSKIRTLSTTQNAEYVSIY